MLGRADVVIVVIGTPVDEFLGPSMTVFERAVDQIAPHLRDGALVVLRSTVYPGTTEYVAQNLADRGCRRRRRVLPRADRRGPRARGARAPAPDRRRGLRPRGGPGRARCSGARRQDDPDDDPRGRAGEALHEHVALHEVRRREPVLHDRPPGRGRLHERPPGDPRGLPAGRGPARARASPPGRACSRTRCSWRRSPPTTSRWARRRCRSTRACPRTSCRRSSGATAGSSGKTVGILGMAFKAESDDPRASLCYKLRKLLAGPARGPVHGPVRADDPRSSPLDEVLDESDILVLGAPHRAYREPRASAARTSSTSGVPWATGIRLCEGPRHRRRRVHLRLPRARAARAPATRSSALDNFSKYGPLDEVVRRPSALPLRRGRRQGRRRC